MMTINAMRFDVALAVWRTDVCKECLAELRLRKKMETEGWYVECTQTPSHLGHVLASTRSEEGVIE